MTRLPDFLRARATDTERAAAGASGARPARWQNHGTEIFDFTETETIGRVDTEAQALHIAEHSPHLVLDECDALRTIVLQYETAVVARDDVSIDLTERTVRAAVVVALERVLEELAAVHMGHPDYDMAWRPGRFTPRF